MMSISGPARRRESRALWLVCGLGELANGSGDPFRVADVFGIELSCVNVSVTAFRLGLGELAKGSGDAQQFDLVGGIARVEFAGGELAKGSELDGSAGAEILPPLRD